MIRNSPPFGSIITVGEGEVGLPHKRFYAGGNRDAVSAAKAAELSFILNISNVNYKLFNDTNLQTVTAYKMLIRDFAINYGLVSDKAKKFADDVFYYEERIVSLVPEQKETAILPLVEVQKRAPTVCILEINHHKYYLNMHISLMYMYT